MRFAIPYPCCGPSALSVFKTISASVPCQTSVLFVIVLPRLGFQKERSTSLVGTQQGSPFVVASLWRWEETSIRQITCEAI